MIKTIRLTLCFSIMWMLWSACEEAGVDQLINFNEQTTEPTPTPTTNSDRVILLEEFTGVRCANCPAGAELAEQLAKQYEGQVIIVSIHSGAFSIPYPNAENFKIEEGIEIENLLGKAAGYPSASINRMLFDGESRHIIPSTNWSRYLKSELDKPASVIININEKTYESESLQVSTSLAFMEHIDNAVKLSVMLVEDDIVSPQDVDGVKVDDYTHKHVLRAMLTPFNGIALAPTIETGATFENNFSFTNFADHWDANKMYVVILAHRSGGDLSVLQAKQIKVVEQ